VWRREPRRVSALPELPRRDARALGHRALDRLVEILLEERGREC